jgi:hypothetical protein
MYSGARAFLIIKILQSIMCCILLLAYLIIDRFIYMRFIIVEYFYNPTIIIKEFPRGWKGIIKFSLSQFFQFFGPIRFVNECTNNRLSNTGTKFLSIKKKKTIDSYMYRVFISGNFTIFVFKCWIILKPVLGGVDANLHFPVSFINMLKETKRASNIFNFAVLGVL